jgi:hypothetical protein
VSHLDDSEAFMGCCYTYRERLGLPRFSRRYMVPTVRIVEVAS